MFHAVVAQGSFLLPAPSVPLNRHWAPCHAVVAILLLIAFELLLCIYLESLCVQGFAAVNLKIVFLPLLTFEIIILIDNLRMCRALMPGDEDNMSDEAIWETLPDVKQSSSCSLNAPSYVKDMHWKTTSEKSFIVLSNVGKLYFGEVDFPLKEVMDNVDAVEWSTEGKSVAVARMNVISILSAKFEERISISLSFRIQIMDW